MVIKHFINLKNLRSAVAFFFLFFLHGTSIGNGLQGISYNGCKYAVVLMPHICCYNQCGIFSRNLI